jgi:hypothetical protein
VNDCLSHLSPPVSRVGADLLLSASVFLRLPAGSSGRPADPWERVEIRFGEKKKLQILKYLTVEAFSKDGLL